MTPTGIELNLPDLPEVPIQLGPSPSRGTPRPPVPWSVRVRDALTAYLPLLLMVALALGTWWLVKNTPSAPAAREEAAPRGEPDYTMRGFAIQRFGRDGRLLVRLEGRQMRHFPDTDRTEIDVVTVHAWSADGRETVATARRALANGDASEIQLLGGAQVSSRTVDGQPIELVSEFLHLFTRKEQVRTDQPVRVRVGHSDVRAQGLLYDHLSQQLELSGPMRAVLPPRTGPGAAR